MQLSDAVGDRRRCGKSWEMDGKGKRREGEGGEGGEAGRQGDERKRRGKGNQNVIEKQKGKPYLRNGKETLGGGRRERP